MGQAFAGSVGGLSDVDGDGGATAHRGNPVPPECAQVLHVWSVPARQRVVTRELSHDSIDGSVQRPFSACELHSRS